MPKFSHGTVFLIWYILGVTKKCYCYASHIIDTDTGQLYHMNFSSMMSSLQHHVISNEMASTKLMQALDEARLTFHSFEELQSASTSVSSCLSIEQLDYKEIKQNNSYLAS